MIWSDSSATDGVLDGGGGATPPPNRDIREVRVAAGALCSSTRGELFAPLMEGRPPPPVRGPNRLDAVETHQLRAGHWSGSAQYLHRIGRHPSPECAQCSDRGCRAGWCRACGEEADTPDHVLLRCPALMNARLRIFGTIFPSLSDVRRDDAVAALARVARYLQSR